MDGTNLPGAELRSLLRQADRNKAWLAKQFGLSQTQITRWADQGVPERHVAAVRALLRPLERA